MMDGIDDVIESMERFADRHWMHDEGQNVREFAQRLRAAKKACTAEATLPFDDLISRMKARCIDEKHSPELWPFIEEMEAAVKQERAKVDQHKIREALLEARRFVWTSAHRTDRDLLVTDDEKRGPYVLSPKDTLAKIDAALSAPPRNCDVGTPDERMHRYNELCREISDRHERIGAHAPSFAFPTEFEWEDRPYEEGGSE